MALETSVMETTYEADGGVSGVNFIVTLRIYGLESLDNRCHLLCALVCLID